MSVGTLITLMVVAESVVLFVALRWLVRGLKTAGARDWPPVIPLAPDTAVPSPRDSTVRPDETVAVGS